MQLHQGARQFLGSYSHPFLLFPWIYWHFHLLTQASARVMGGRVFDTQFFVCILKSRHVDKEILKPILSLRKYQVCLKPSKWQKKDPLKMKVKLIRWPHFGSGDRKAHLPHKPISKPDLVTPSRRWIRCCDYQGHLMMLVAFFQWVMS